MHQENPILSAVLSVLPELAIVASIVAAAGIIWNVFVTRKTAKQLVTLDFLEKYKSDMQTYKDRMFASFTQDEKDASEAKVATAIERMNFFEIFLDKYEMLAIGLNHKIYDESMIFDALAFDIIKIYELSEVFIMQARRNMRLSNRRHEKIYADFKVLAEKAEKHLAQQLKPENKKRMYNMVMSGEKSQDHVIKHLEMIQGVVNRLAHCSFLIKGWSLAILAAVVVFYARSGIDSPNTLLAFFAPIVGFAVLDAYYLWQERLFRAIYNEVRKWESTDFSMPVVEQMKKPGCQYWAVLFSRTILGFYFIEVAFLVIVFFTLCK